MQTKKCIETRRSTRRFNSDTVKREDVEKAVAWAQWSPTWKNSQTVRFTAIYDRAVIDKIANEAVPKFNKVILDGAPVLMVVSSVMKRSGYERDGSPTTVLGDAYTYFDCGATCQTFSLALHDIGLSSVILGIFDSQKLKKILSVDDNQQPVVLMPIGYASMESMAPKRKETADILKFI